MNQNASDAQESTVTLELPTSVAQLLLGTCAYEKEKAMGEGPDAVATWADAEARILQQLREQNGR